MNQDTPVPEATRLERLWSGDFGDDYVDRNKDFAVRQGFWQELLATNPCRRVLEVGCNIGGNLQWIAQTLPPQDVYGVDVNLKALRQLRQTVPDVNAVWSAGRELPFRDGWFDLVFTFGVLIHQPDDTLPLLMAEIVRTSRRYVLCGEYFARDAGGGAVPGVSRGRSSSATTAGSTNGCSRSSDCSSRASSARRGLGRHHLVALRTDVMTAASRPFGWLP